MTGQKNKRPQATSSHRHLGFPAENQGTHCQYRGTGGRTTSKGTSQNRARLGRYGVQGYSGPESADWVQTETGATVEIVKRPRRRFRVKEGEEPPQLPPEPAGFKILPRRWVVERSFAWLGKYRRLSKDYEAAVQHSESMIYLGNDSIDA